tara:strand:- start:90 stop:824 length:735 start_codon:yes stop_codon:yes gene_type:complete
LNFCRIYIKQFIGILFILIIFVQCETQVERRTIDTGSPLTILAPKYETLPEKIEWYFGSRPDKSKIGLDISFESVRFTPDYNGHYDIVAELFNNNDELIYYKVFQYNAIGQNIFEEEQFKENHENNKEIISNTLIIDSLNLRSQIDSNKIKKIIESDIDIDLNDKLRYTIQVFSFPDEQQAIAKKELLNSFGFESYIISFIHPKFKVEWFRVRVGKFIEFSKADSISHLIKQKLNIDTWIDRSK